MSNVTHNPEDRPIEELPVIYGFNNGGCHGWMTAQALAEDGTPLGSHCCSSEGFMPGDLGMIEGFRCDRHENEYRPHYPKGYRTEFVPGERIETHAGLTAAIALAEAEYEKEQAAQ
tara:strand:+ start:3240 stop:3587 length:348 start_codon:yes stop_codon:yes gene_type:complete